MARLAGPYDRNLSRRALETLARGGARHLVELHGVTDDERLAGELRQAVTVRRFRFAEDVTKYERTLARRGFVPHPNARTGKTRWQHVDGSVVMVYQEATRSYVALAWGA